jgi:hypothetical protein
MSLQPEKTVLNVFSILAHNAFESPFLLSQFCSKQKARIRQCDENTNIVKPTFMCCGARQFVQRNHMIMD